MTGPTDPRRHQLETLQSVKKLLSDALDEVENTVQCHDDELQALRAETEENQRIIAVLNKRIDQLMNRDRGDA